MFALTSMRKLNKLGGFLPLLLPEVAVYNSSFIESGVVKSLLSSGWPRPSLDYRYSFTTNPEIKKQELLERLWALDLKTYLVSLLSRMDKITMAASIEARVPFLDHRLVEWGLRIPSDLKIRGLQTKFIVKKLGERMLLKQVIYRRKSGFSIPISSWLLDKTRLGRYLDLLQDRKFRQRRYLDIKKIERLVSDHISARSDHGEILWERLDLELSWGSILKRVVDFGG